MGCNFSDNRADSSAAWIWRNRRGIGGNCQVLIFSVPGDVRDLLFLRLERKKGSISPAASLSQLLEGLRWPVQVNLAAAD